MSETCKDKVCPKLSAPVYVPKLGIQMHEVKCIEHRCAHYKHILGNDPQTGKTIDHWDCSLNWVPLLLIETSKEVRQGAAATESLRNENVSIGTAIRNAIRAKDGQTLISEYMIGSLPGGS